MNPHTNPFANDLQFLKAWTLPPSPLGVRWFSDAWALVERK